MAKLKGVFDRRGTVFRPPRRWLVREFASLVTTPGTEVPPHRVDPAQGDWVLVVPPFLTPDLFMAPFRDALQACGHRVEGWSLGPNFGLQSGFWPGCGARPRAWPSAAAGRSR